jgi:HNH endonuclease
MRVPSPNQLVRIWALAAPKALMSRYRNHAPERAGPPRWLAMRSAASTAACCLSEWQSTYQSLIRLLTEHERATIAADTGSKASIANGKSNVPLLTISEAGIASGFSIELLDSLTKRCPKPGQTRVLSAKAIDGALYIDDRELQSYLIYLREPWPLPTSGTRPRVPDAIACDVREECHQCCAICGDMNHGEIAHIDPVAETLNNSPDNLILLCPNHHTEYDYGHRPASNVGRDGILAAKQVKRMSRRRMLRFEANVAGTLRTVLGLVKTLESRVKENVEDDVREAYVTELQALIEKLPELSRSAQEAAERDADFALAESALLELAPKLISATQGAAMTASETRAAAATVVSASRSIIRLDEVSCPHCKGRGTTGLMGQLCAYCRGDQVVTETAAASYDPDAIDEVACPHCGGSGTTGLMGAVCAYCGGDCMVTSDAAAEYDPDAIDEVACPHCGGSGTTGLMGAVCAYCRGDCMVTSDAAAEYDPDAIDEVACPHCGGSGTTGLMGAVCAYCRGDCMVTSAAAAEYDPSTIDEVACPRCEGTGTIGLSSTICRLCHGDTVVSAATASEFRPWKDAG